jgi:hypothetical protein
MSREPFTLHDWDVIRYPGRIGIRAICKKCKYETVSLTNSIPHPTMKIRPTKDSELLTCDEYILFLAHET